MKRLVVFIILNFDTQQEFLCLRNQQIWSKCPWTRNCLDFHCCTSILFSLWLISENIWMLYNRLWHISYFGCRSIVIQWHNKNSWTWHSTIADQGWTKEMMAAGPCKVGQEKRYIMSLGPFRVTTSMGTKT